MSTAKKRLIKEYKSIQKELANDDSNLRSSGVLSLHPTEDSLFDWNAIILGPDGTPFKGVAWKLTIKIPDSYPLSPPEFRFVTDIQKDNKNSQRTNKDSIQDNTYRICNVMPHPNIHFKTGEICLDILQSDKWSPAWTLSSSILGILLLLSQPEPLSPLNIDLGNLLKADDYDAYEDTIKFYIGKYSQWEDISD